MNPYYYHQSQNYYGFPHPSPVMAYNHGGWIYDPMSSTATQDCLVVLNPQPPVEYVDNVVILNDQQPLRYSYTPILGVSNLRAESNTFSDRPFLPIPYHPLEPNYLENPFSRIEQEGSLVLEEITVNQSARTTGSGGLSEETITRRLQASVAAQEKTTKGQEEGSDVCAICLEGYEYDDGCKKMARLECGHGYHVHCIKPWLLRKNVCPMCKATAFTM